MGAGVEWRQSFSLARWKVLEMDGGEGCLTAGMCSVPLSDTLCSG